MGYFPKLLTIILTLFFLMICGYVCRKKGIIDNKASKALSQLIISVGQPMMIINALNRAEFSEKNLNIAWQVVVISFAMHV
ncbi:MAG: AEC family transporter, partial [Clostridia bacterium]|nr:AEC family transporter [Clostridia bacterium]